MPDGFLLSRQTLEMIRRDHFELRTQVKNLRSAMERMQIVSGAREEQVIVKLDADLNGINSNVSPPQMNSARGKVQIMALASGQSYAEIKDPSVERGVKVYNATTSDFESGDLVVCQRNSLTGRFVIQASGAGELVRFRLNEDLQEYKRPADLEPQYWFASADSLGFTFDPTNDDSTNNGLSLGESDTGDITVHDPWGKFRGAKGPRTDPGMTDIEGCHGYAQLINGTYHIVECEMIAKMIRFTVNNTAGYSQTDGLWNVNLDDFWHGADPGTVTQVNNFFLSNAPATTYLFEGQDGATGLAAYDEIEDLYRIIQMELDCSA